MQIRKLLSAGLFAAGGGLFLGIGCGEDDPACYSASGGRVLEETWTEGCQTCTCNINRTITCQDAPGCTAACEDESGESHEVGSFWPSGDGCNLCQCVEAGDIECTANSCGVPCIYAGEQKAPGSSFDAIDGCNTCECLADGNVSCTEEVCPCDPPSEWWRDYVGMSPAECAVLDFSCPDHTSAFENECGCGCEQSNTCAQSYNCMPPNECDIPELQANCPYSEILQ